MWVSMTLAVIAALSFHGNTASDLGKGGSKVQNLQGILSERLCESKIERKQTIERVRQLAVDKYPAKGIYWGESSQMSFARTSSSVTYESRHGKALKKGEALYFRVPKDLSQNTLGSIQLIHGQNEAKSPPEWYFDKSKKEWRDTHPAKTSVQLFDMESKKYFVWCKGYSGKIGSKFADAGVERETLQEFPKVCGCEIGNAESRKCDLKVGAIRLVNDGPDEVQIYGVGLMSIPKNIDPNCKTHEFGHDTRFGDVRSFSGTIYGGGDAYGGRYPGAIKLGDSTYKPKKIPTSWSYHRGSYGIPLEQGKRLALAEFIIGDRKPDGIKHSEGVGSKGAAFLSVSIKNGNREERLIRRSVPPAGVIPAFPKNCGQEILAGSRLQIKNSGYDPAYIMGVRICYEKERQR